jgi:hypothetical protein
VGGVVDLRKEVTKEKNKKSVEEIKKLPERTMKDLHIQFCPFVYVKDIRKRGT